MGNSAGLVAVACALVAAMLFATGSALQHQVSTASVRLSGGRPGDLVSFGRAVLRKPVWGLALLCEVVGIAFHAVALHEGALVLVQPLLVMSVIFALPLRRRMAGVPSSRSELFWAAALVGGLAMFLLAATPASAKASGADGLPALVLSASAVTAFVVSVAVGRRRSGAGRALAYGAATGLAFALAAALIKASGDRLLSAGPLRLVEGWQFWAMVVVGGAGGLMNQLAFQSGPLSASMPAIHTVDPVLSVLLGVVVYDERLRAAPWALSAEVVGLLAVVVSTIMLSRTPWKDGERQVNDSEGGPGPRPAAGSAGGRRSLAGGRSWRRARRGPSPWRPVDRSG